MSNRFSCDGRDYDYTEGDSVGVALLRGKLNVLSRSIKYHRPRGLFCVSGHCGACLVRIDGAPNCKACHTRAEPGMRVERQNAFPSVSFDILAAADLMFARGMDHHTMMTRPRPLNAILRATVRNVGGSGTLPDANRVAKNYVTRRLHVDVAIIGGGPAGLQAAIKCARAQLSTLLIDEQPQLGGSLWTEPQNGAAAACALARDANTAGVQTESSATAIGWYAEDRLNENLQPGLLAINTPSGLLLVRAKRYLYATGAYDQNALFVNNDRPGILSARAVGRLLTEYDFVAGKRVCIVGKTNYGEILAAALIARGVRVEILDETLVRSAFGASRVRGLHVMRGGHEEPVACDLVAIDKAPAPASELPRQHGVPVRNAVAGFTPIANADGRTDNLDVFVAGDVLGHVGVAAATASGAHVGESIVRSLAERAA